MNVNVSVLSFLTRGTCTQWVLSRVQRELVMISILFCLTKIIKLRCLIKREKRIMIIMINDNAKLASV